jgi:bifunctional NMN adenylyltransferase/nudix hydrolase
MLEKSNRVGVIVGRFQVDQLHVGHCSLIKRVAEKHNEVLILIGVAPTRGTDTNPLDFATRRCMFDRNLLSTAGIIGSETNVSTMAIPDHASDEVWSKTLDASVSHSCQGREAIVYGSRDSFVIHYSGRYPTVIFDEIQAPSGTAIREEIGTSPTPYCSPTTPYSSVAFRAGVIYSTQQRFPISYQCVDAAIFDSAQPGIDPVRILLGRKPGETLFRFPGGFVDPTDPSLEFAACREVDEETGICVTSAKYLGSYRIDDHRYRRDKDKIMTALFMVNAGKQIAIAFDDLEEVRWFDGIPVDQIMPNHRILAHAVLAKIREIAESGDYAIPHSWTADTSETT